MPFHAERFSNCFSTITGKEVAEVLSINVAAYDSINSPGKRAKFIKLLMEELTQKLPASETAQVMQSCGMQCIGNSTMQKAKRIYKEAKGLEDFLAKLNENHIGGGMLRLEGDVITGGYNRCYCGSINQSKEKIPLTYCNCSAGWYKRLFEETLEKPVQVEVLQTIAAGADSCRFRITLENY